MFYIVVRREEMRESKEFFLYLVLKDGKNVF
jgi:hypothetical protein